MVPPATVSFRETVDTTSATTDGDDAELNPATNKVEPWKSPDPWPSNYEVVTPTPQLFGQTFDGPMPGHIPTMPWHWDLHVWIWAHNPSGMFAEWNPSLQCERVAGTTRTHTH